MFSTELANKDVDLTLESILERVTEYDIYKAYLGEFKIGKIYNSPFRRDKNPSFGIFYSKSKDKLLYKDHGTGDSGDIIKFVQNYAHISTYVDTLKEIQQKLNITNDTQFVSSKHYIPSSEIEIGIVRQSFTETDVKYWSQFNISIDTLKKFNVFSIQYYLSNGIVRWKYKNDNPMYAYKVYNHFKIYRPLADKRVKWRNNLTAYDIQGLKQLPKNGDILIITKSLKDVMCLYEMGISAISPSSESTFIPESILKRILKHYKQVLILFDRDAAGIKNMRSQSLKTGLKCMLMHKKFKAKDISDAVKKNGFEIIKNWLYAELEKERNR